jgi:hypothetical protein
MLISQDNFNNLLNMYTDKKILPILVRLVDLAHGKNWQGYLDEKTNEWILKIKDKDICRLKIQIKKVIVNILDNDLVINLHLGKDKENKKNLELISYL